MTRRKNVEPEMVQIEAHELERLRLRIGALEGVEGTQQLEIQRLEADYKKYRNLSMDLEKQGVAQREEISNLREKLYETEHQVSRMAGYLQALEDQKPPVIRSIPEDRPMGPNAMLHPVNTYDSMYDKRKGWYNV